MPSKPDNRPHNPRLLRNELFAAWKRWLAVSLFAKFMVFTVGVTSVWFSLATDTVPYLVGLFMICGELAMWRSDRLKNIAEALHRKLDYEGSFGWPITNAEISDILARTNCDLQKLSEDMETGSNFFASASAIGSLRAADNLQESSWWSKHLAESMWIICLLVIIILVSSSIFLLVASINTVRNFTILGNVGRVITSVILLIFSLGLFRFMIGYFSFAKAAEKTEEAVKILVAHPPVDHVGILKLWQEYQFARASAPILPNWIWKRREKKLNRLWSLYRA